MTIIPILFIPVGLDMNIPAGTLLEYVQLAARGQGLRLLAVVCCMYPMHRASWCLNRRRS